MDLKKKQTQKLIKACIQNDRSAQEALYKYYYADMMQVCLSYLADEELAQEAYNTGFLKVLRAIKNFDTEKGELGGWIRKIMICCSIDLYRAELKFTNVTGTLPAQEQEFLPPAVLEKLYFEDILRCIRTLPCSMQTVFNLSVMDGFSHKEITEQLNISEGTSRWYLSEAKKQLRDLLKNTSDAGSSIKRGDKK